MGKTRPEFRETGFNCSPVPKAVVFLHLKGGKPSSSDRESELPPFNSVCHRLSSESYHQRRLQFCCSEFEVLKPHTLRPSILSFCCFSGWPSRLQRQMLSPVSFRRFVSSKSCKYTPSKDYFANIPS